MGNVCNQVGIQTIQIIGGRHGTLPIIVRPRQNVQNVNLAQGVNGQIIHSQNKVLIKPAQMQLVQQIRNVPENNILRAMQRIAEIDNQHDKFLTMHYIMSQDNVSRQQARQQTKAVLQQAMNRTQPGSIPTDFKQLNEGLESVGVDVDWTRRTGIKSAISIHVLSGMTESMLRCTYTESNHEHNFQRLVQQNNLLGEHYNNIKKEIATKFGIEQEFITIIQIKAGSVITSFMVNAQKIRSKLSQKNIDLHQGQAITIHPYFEHFKLSPEDFDPFGNCDYTKEAVTQEDKYKLRVQKRGTIDYHKPLSCKRYGLNVWDRFEDNNWLIYQNPEEWAIFYHGVSSPANKTNQNKKVLNSIMEERLLKPGSRQMYHGYKCEAHQNCKIPEKGVYLTSNIDIAMEFAGSSERMSNGKIYKLAFQCKVKPDQAHKVTSLQGQVYWVVQQSKYIRPYGIVLKNVFK